MPSKARNWQIASDMHGCRSGDRPTWAERQQKHVLWKLPWGLRSLWASTWPCEPPRFPSGYQMLPSGHKGHDWSR